MVDTLYADNLVDVLEEKKPDLAAAGDSKAVKKVIQDVKKEAAERTPRPFETDKWIYRGTVAVLGAAVLYVAYAQLQIVMTEPLPGGNIREIPDGLIALGSAAIGALAGLLAPTPSR